MVGCGAGFAMAGGLFPEPCATTALFDRQEPEPGEGRAGELPEMVAGGTAAKDEKPVTPAPRTTVAVPGSHLPDPSASPVAFFGLGKEQRNAPEQAFPPSDSPRKTALAAGSPDFSYRDAYLSEDTTWRGEVLVEGGVTVASPATLTIEPGTVVRFRRGRKGATNPVLVVQGRIQTNGTEQKPVVFSSAYEEPLPGDWLGIIVLGSEKKNVVRYARITGATTGLDVLFSTINVQSVFIGNCGTGLRVQDSLFAMAGGGARDCLVGAELDDSEADIKEASFSGNKRGVVALRTSLHLVDALLEGNVGQALLADDCRILLAGCRFSANGSGLSLSAGEGTVTASTFAGNGEYGLHLGKSRTKITGNEITKNGRYGIWVDDGRGIAWGNAIFANGSYDLYNSGTDDFLAIGNWWGDAKEDEIARHIYVEARPGDRGRVLYRPVLPSRPETRP